MNLEQIFNNCFWKGELWHKEQLIILLAIWITLRSRHFYIWCFVILFILWCVYFHYFEV